MAEINSIHPLWMVVGAGVISFIPLLLGMLTSYLKVSIVLGMIKNAIGAGQIPGAAIVMALSLAITIFIMGPVIEASSVKLSEINQNMLFSAPSAEKLKVLNSIFEPWRDFLLKHASKREVEVLWATQPSTLAPSDNVSANIAPTETPLRILIPAFVLTELKEAFSMGFVLLLPFLAIDLIVANVLAGMGMFMVSPTMVALPLKLILFVLSDAWLLITRGLIASYQL